MAEYKVKEGVNVHKIIAGFGGVNINATMPKKLIDVCLKAELTQYFEEIPPASVVNVSQLKSKNDGKITE